MDAVFVYVTVPDKAEALRIGRILVEERLIACANILDGLTSIYWWDGAIQQGPEAAFIAKTRAGLVEALTDRVRQLHPYEVPCVVALPVAAGNPDFLDWITAETRPQS